MIDPSQEGTKPAERRSAPAASSINQHLIEIQRNREAWDRKPALRKAYGTFYRLIQAELARGSGLTVELGSGIGAIKEFISDCVTTDLFPNPWLDRTENAYRLSFANGAVTNLILFDVFHHLEFPGVALREFERVLPAGGRLILMEPGFGLLGRFIYQRFHHEPLGFDRAVPWDAPGGFDPDAQRYYAAQANAWRIFVRHEFQPDLAKWRLLAARRLAALSYVASGGFSGPSLYPDRFFGGMLVCDKVLGLFPSIFSTRLLVVLEKLS
ncbi:MAG: methyltransferase domain-containing protein [Verrucomicrobia bacterium]|nr:methyltransferase domain-containing protein [Verrucomicrobiota bacterium]